MVRSLLRAAMTVTALGLAQSVAVFAGSSGDTIDCANPASTVAINYCADIEFEKADANLNVTFKNAIAAIPAMAGEAPYDAKSWESALRASQRAWLAFRDAECAGHVPMFWSGGTGTSADVIGCKSALTQARIQQLNDRYEKR